MRVPRRIFVLAALTLAIVGGVAGCGASSSSSAGAATQGGSNVPGAQHLDVNGFAVLTATPDTILIDVRTPAEFAAGHLADARNLDFTGGTFAAALTGLDKSASYALYCHSGNRSGQAAQLMTAAGFTHVADLSGGITAWQSAGRPVATS